MAGIAIIANPNARRNREWPLAAQQLRKAAPGAPLYETRGAEELAVAARRIAAERPRVLAIAGGDGTVTHTVTALAQAMDGQLPPLALLGGGAYDSLAPLGGKGDAEDRLKRLVDALASGNELSLEQRDTLRITEEPASPATGGARRAEHPTEEPASPATGGARRAEHPTEEPASPATGGGRSPEHPIGRCGFRFGVGLPVRFIEAFYARGGGGPWNSMWLLLRVFGSSLTAGPFARRLYAPMDLRVRFDGEEWPRVPIYGLVCSTVAEAGLGLRPFRRATEQPGAFQALGLTAGPRQLALEMPRLVFGRPARRDRLLEGVGENLELSGRAPLQWLLDGEIYTSSTGQLSVGLGPRVSLVRT